MAMAPEQAGIGIRRHFTTDGVHPYDEIEWERRDARITNYRDGQVAFEQLGVEVPVGWSLNATNILAQKYFRGTLGTAEREWSLKQVADRVVDTITKWGTDGGYFTDDREAAAFSAELKHLIVTQKAAFNSPVWFNIGVAGVPQQASACFILAVDDTMDSILNWYVEGRHHLQGRLRRGHQPLEDPVLARAAEGRRHGIGSGELHARCRCVGRHDQVGRQDAPRRQDGHPQRRSSRRRRVHLVQGQRRAQGARAARRRLRHGPRRRRQSFDAVPERQQLGAGHRRVHAGRARRRRLASPRREDRRDPQDHQGPRSHAPDLDGHVGVRRPRHAVRHHHQPVAHRAQHRPHQRLQPVQRVHAPRQLGVQPGQHQLAAVPRHERRLRRRRLQGGGRGRVHRAGDPRRQRRLPDREDRRDEPSVPSAGPRLRQPRCVAHGTRSGLRLRRRPRLGGGDHRADDRPCLRGVGSHGGTHGPVRRLRREQRAHAARARHAPPGGGAHRRRARARRGAVRRAGGVGQRVRSRHHVRRAQLPGVRARTHRHHRPADGLRHHRHRARPRAREDEEARGWRHDVDRQPDDPACAAPPRLQRGADRRDHRLHRRAQVDPRRAASRGRARVGVRLLDGRQHHPLLGPCADDGCGAAVHQRCDLEDRQHARRRIRSKTSSSFTSMRGVSASRPSPSTATTARWPSRSRR